MFIRSKVVKGETYYQAVESYRDRATGRVRHRTVVSLGRHPTLAGALTAEEEALKRLRRKWTKFCAGVGSAEKNPMQEREGASLERRIAASVAKVETLQRRLGLSMAEIALQGTVEDAARRCIMSPTVIRQIRLLNRPENLDLWQLYESQDVHCPDYTLEGLCWIALDRARSISVDTTKEPEVSNIPEESGVVSTNPREA